MNDLEIQRELFSFDEKRDLAALEVAKAKERVAEIAYAKSRFLVDMMAAKCKAQSMQVTQGDSPAESKQA